MIMMIQTRTAFPVNLRYSSKTDVHTTDQVVQKKTKHKKKSAMTSIQKLS